MILITGATGAIGGSVAKSLAAEGQALRLLVRDPARAPELPNSEVVKGEYGDASSLKKAFTGIELAFVVSGHTEPGMRAKLHKNAFDAAAQAGVKHLVYLSFQGAAPDSKFPMARDHSESEGYLRATGVPYTALRDSMYLDELPGMFGADGVLRGPAGNGAAAFVAREDVARVVAALLTDPPGESGVYDVTGPEALTLSQAASRMSALTGRKLRYEDETLEEGRAWRSQSGAQAWEVAVWLGSYEAVAAGELAPVSDTVERFTGRPAQSLEAYFGAHPALLET